MHVDILGTSFTIQTDEDPEYVEKLLRYLEKKTAETSASVQTRDPLKLAIISALMITDELFQLREHPASESPAADASTDTTRFSNIAQELIRQIDMRLGPESAD